MEAFAQTHGAIFERGHERLGNVVGMHVMDSLHAKIGKGHRLALCQLLENARIEMPGGIEWDPAWPYDVTEVEDSGRESMSARLIQKVDLDRGFADAILPKRPSRLFLGDGYFNAVAMHPDSPAMEEMLHPTL